jgi:phospholipase A1
MKKTIFPVRAARTTGRTIAIRKISLSLTLILVLFCPGPTLAQDNSASEQPALQSPPAAPQAPQATDTTSDPDDETKEKKFFFTVHRPNYFLGFTYNDNPNKATYAQAGREVPNNYEAKFQLSFKIRLKQNLIYGKGDLYAAYTQASWWQIYNTSAPFRETNYEPELFLRFNTDFPVLAGLRNKQVLIGFAHQSNGQGGDLSRSWNRVYLEFIARKGDFMLALKPWYRIPENARTDDNPDIDEYLGYGKLYGAYKLGNLVFSFTLHNNLRFDENRSGIELGLSYALQSNLRLYVQYYNGYGESLIDYNNFTNRIGAGIMINDWL